MTRICKAISGVGVLIGEAQDADERICLAKIGVGPRIGDSDIIITEDGFEFITEDGDSIILE